MLIILTISLIIKLFFNSILMVLLVCIILLFFC
nr:MAG TPA: hypothetical protein [Caudoviricetes sp.]